MGTSVSVYVLVAAVLAVSGLSIASAATAWSAAGHHGHHHKKKHRRSAKITISGGLATPLGLGSSGARPLNLSIKNRRGKRLIVSHIRVSVASVRQEGGAHGSCAQNGPHSPNFVITNLPAAYKVKVPAHATRSLAQLGQHQEPMITWVNQPWAQNGCLGSTLSFSYHAKGRYAKKRRHHHKRRHR
jgi:hypothetical protein